MSNVRNENPDAYRFLPCCGIHVIQVIPLFAGFRVLITTALCLWLMFSKEISEKEQLIILWNSAIAAVFVYGVFERKKVAIYAYGYLEIIAITYHVISLITWHSNGRIARSMETNDENVEEIFSPRKTGWVVLVLLCLAVTLVLSVIYFTRVVFLYIKYLRSIELNPPAIFVDKGELVPMNNTSKSRVNNRPEQARITF